MDKISTTYTADEQTIPRLTKGFLSFYYSQARVRAVYALFIVLLAFNSAVGQSATLGINVALVVYMVLLPVMIYRNTKRALRIWASPGMSMHTVVGSDSLTISTQQATSEVKFSAFRQLAVRGDCVILRQANTRIYNILPRQLFPDNSLVILRQHIPQK